MADNYEIHLNFLRVAGEFPSYEIYRHPRQPDEPKPSEGVRGFSLPANAGDDDYRPFWVTLSPDDGYEQCRVQPDVNRHLTCWVLYESLRSAIAAKLQATDFNADSSRFAQELDLVMRRHAEGDELLVVQPYFLHEHREFGWLVDFHFRLAKDVPYSHRVQRLTLSLNSAGRRNFDYYLDRTQKILGFVREHRELLSELPLPGSNRSVAFETDFRATSATRLRTKVYVFGGGRDGRSQFNGLRDHGPLAPVQTPPKLLFAFREQDRHVARTLAMALKGPRQPARFGFPGFESLFKTQFTIDSNPIVLSDLSTPSFQAALQRVQSDRKNDLGVLPIFVLPEGDDNGYLDAKALFAHSGVPSQVCTLPVIQDDYALKWAIGNVALQIFCKAGGQPWKVRPTTERALILGISQSHKVRKTEAGSEVEKYFAFSVMTDNSGLFQRIEVLGDAPNESNYLGQLRQNLAQLLAAEASNFHRVVVHTSFKLKFREIDAIRATVEQASRRNGQQTQFAVVKVNHRSRFFGVNRAVNCLVPYESTKVRLGAGQYLVWFEGIYPDKPSVTKLFPGPTHLEFLRWDGMQPISDDDLLQDLVNLSGANWRGFNAKSAPVSVFYCHLVADMVHDFHSRSLPLPAMTDLRPWFL